MPIKPEHKDKYPPNWHEISGRMKELTDYRCEGSPAYPLCTARAGELHPITGSLVVVTTAHLDHDPTNNCVTNLRVWCQRCHLTYDAAHHAKNAAITRRKQKEAEGQTSFIEE